MRAAWSSACAVVCAASIAATGVSPVAAASAQAAAPANPQLVTVPVARAQQTRQLELLRTAHEKQDFAAVLREGVRTLEYFPNDPAVQAGIYAAMAEAASQNGSAVRAGQFEAAARALDPAIGARIDAELKNAPVTRGDKLNKLGAALSVLGATVGAVQQARQQSRDAKMQQMQMQLQQMQLEMQMQQLRQQAAYPAAPVGMTGYQPPPPGAQMPMPGYGPAPGGAPMPGGMPAQGPGLPPLGAAPTGAPYSPPGGYTPGPALRGAAMAPVRVLHDHSQLGDDAFFAHSCGALVSIDGANLVFTPSGGEAPRVIPMADIVDVASNQTVGTAIGAFHISTSKGLYLHLAPPSGRAGDGQALVAALVKQLKR